MRKIRFGEPNEKQKLFLLDHHRHVAYGGARGGGKSWAVRTKAKLLALRFKGIKILIVRRTMPELRNNHIEPLKKELAGIAKYNSTDKTFRFPSGSTITFGYCDNAGHLGQYQGAEYDVLFIDEAGQLQKEWIDAINACVRGTNSFPKRTYYTLNPGGPAHAYFKRLFVDRRFEEKEKPENYNFIQALVQDNKVLMRIQPEYIDQLETLPPKIREAWLYGRWDVYEGQFFEDFRDDPEHYRDRRWTHVIEPFEIPDGWTWLKGKNIIGVADPACWAADRGESIMQTAARYGVYFTKGDNERIAGWMQCHYRLQFDKDGYPRMYVFAGCKAFIRTIPMLMYDEHKAEDLDTKMEDHCADEWRYMCMSRPIKPTVPAEAPPILFDPLDIMKRR